jgi:SRSO17 transposase
MPFEGDRKMNYYTAFEEGNTKNRVVFAWPAGQSPHQSQHHFMIRGPWSTKEAAEKALENGEG